MTTFENQITNYPKGARVEAIREIPLSSPSQNYYADSLPRGTRGVVTAHTDDGRAWINFDGHGQEGFGHTFEQPEKYIRVVCTHRDDNCPTNHDAPAAPERGERWTSVNMTEDPRDPRLTIEEGDKLLATAYDAATAQRIITEHNQHSTLIAQRERLRLVLAGLSRRHPYCWCGTWVGGEHEAECLAAQEAMKLTTIEQEGREG